MFKLPTLLSVPRVHFPYTYTNTLSTNVIGIFFSFAFLLFANLFEFRANSTFESRKEKDD